MDTQTLLTRFSRFDSLLGLAWFDWNTQLLETNLIFSDERIVELIKPVLSFFGGTDAAEDLILLEIEATTLAFSKQHNGVFVFHLTEPDEIEAVVTVAKGLPIVDQVHPVTYPAVELPERPAAPEVVDHFDFDAQVFSKTRKPAQFTVRSRAKQLLFSSCAAVAGIIVIGGAIGHSQAQAPVELDMSEDSLAPEVERVAEPVQLDLSPPEPTPTPDIVELSGFDKELLELTNPATEPASLLPPVETTPAVELAQAAPSPVVSAKPKAAEPKAAAKPKATKKKPTYKKKKSVKKKRTYTKKRSCNK